MTAMGPTARSPLAAWAAHMRNPSLRAVFGIAFCILFAGAAIGIYLACYFSGGLVGSAVLGQFFDMFGWHACVAGIALALAVAVALTFWLIIDAERTQARRDA